MRHSASFDAVELPPHHHPIPRMPRIPRVAAIAAALLTASASVLGGLAAPALAAGAAPVGVADSYTTYANETLSIATAEQGILANDTDADGEPVVVGDVGGMFGGTVVTMLGDGRFVFTPALDFVGTATFDYRPSDGDLFGAPVTVTIEVQAAPLPDLAPIASDDAYPVQTGVPFVRSAAVGVLANDTDPEGEPLTVISSSGLPLDGPFSVSPDGGFSWTPEEPFCGTTTFTYTVRDATLQTDSATVTLTAVDEGTPVLCGEVEINEPPVTTTEAYEVSPGALFVAGISGSMWPGVLHNDVDPEGAELTAQIVAYPLEGEFEFMESGGFEWWAPADFCGTLLFAYRAFDGHSFSAVESVTLVAVDADGPIECVDGEDVPGSGGEEPTDPAEPTVPTEPTTPGVPAAVDGRDTLAMTGPSEALSTLLGVTLLLMLLGGMALSARTRPRRRGVLDRLARR